MNWDTLKLFLNKLFLKRLTKQLGLHRVGSNEFRDRRISAETSIGDQGTNERSTPYHPDFREKRHDFSQHIGC